MNDLQVAWRQVTARLVTHGLTVATIALAVGLAVATDLLAQGVQRGIDRAAGPFDVLVGSRGNAQQLVINSVLLQGDPLENVPEGTLERVRAHPGVAVAIPLAYGDSTGRTKIIGTTPDLFGVRVRPNAPPFFALVSGRAFEAPFEAVLGSIAASRLGLGVGATFGATHGDEPPIEGDEDEDHVAHPYRVVGILSPTRSPADVGVYVAIESYWEVHASQVRRPGDASGPRAVTAILVKPRLFPQDVYRLQQTAMTGGFGPTVQAVVPYQELVKLNRQVGQGQRILSAVGLGTIAIAGATTFLAMYGSVRDRRRDLAVLRAIGATRWRVARIVLLEGAIVAVAGIGAGIAAAWVGASSLAEVVADASNVQVVVAPGVTTPLMVAAMLGVAVLAGTVPTVQAARTDVASNLSSD
jgi:putative ABC transport system permease protein